MVRLAFLTLNLLFLKYGNCYSHVKINMLIHFLQLKLEKSSSPMHTACQKGNIETVKHLLEIGADVNLPDENGFTPLYIACKYGYSQIVQSLLNKTNNVTDHLSQRQKADVNICSKDRISPLFLACFDGNVEIVQCLLAAGADANLRKGLSPLCIACQRNQGNVVKLLLENKADVNLCSNTGWNPLYAACEVGHVEIVHLLLEAGADVNLCDGNKMTPLNLTTVRQLRFYLRTKLMLIYVMTMEPAPSISLVWKETSRLCNACLQWMLMLIYAIKKDSALYLLLVYITKAR